MSTMKLSLRLSILLAKVDEETITFTELKELQSYLNTMSEVVDEAVIMENRNRLVNGNQP